VKKDQRWQKLAFKPLFFFFFPLNFFVGLFFEGMKHDATLYPLFLLLDPFIVLSCLDCYSSSELLALGRSFLLNYIY